MQDYFRAVFTLMLLTLLSLTGAQADTVEKLVISLESEDSEMAETEISTLATGESRTIETGTGKVFDFLRTADGVEIYVDGNLLEMNFEPTAQHEKHFLKSAIKDGCHNDEACEDSVIILQGPDSGTWESATTDVDKVLLHKEVEITCSDDGEEISCSERTMEGGDDEKVDLDSSYDWHGNGQKHKVIVITKTSVTED